MHKVTLDWNIEYHGYWATSISCIILLLMIATRPTTIEGELAHYEGAAIDEGVTPLQLTCSL